MSVEIDQNVAVLTVQENASEILELANEQLAINGVIDEEGAPAKFRQLAASPAWLFALALGKKVTVFQEALNAASLVLDVDQSSDTQLLSLAQLSGVKRNNGKPSYILAEFTNDNATEVTVQDGALFKDSINNKQWALAQPLTIEPEETKQGYLFCEEVGAYNVPSGSTLDDAEMLYSGVTCKAAQAAVPGEGRESITALRNRIIQGGILTDPIVRAQTAIEALAGIRKCSIFFNTSTEEVAYLQGGIELPIRTAYLVIQGTDVTKTLADTLYKNINVPTLQRDDSLVEYYQRGSSQVAVYYSQAKETPLHITVYVSKSGLSSSYEKSIIDALLAQSGVLNIGEQCTSANVLVWLKTVTDCIIISAEVRNDSELDYGKVAKCDADAFFTIAEENIHIEFGD